jgi:hypothetical protein
LLSSTVSRRGRGFRLSRLTIAYPLNSDHPKGFGVSGLVTGDFETCGIRHHPDPEIAGKTAA